MATEHHVLSRKFFQIWKNWTWISWLPVSQLLSGTINIYTIVTAFYYYFSTLWSCWWVISVLLEKWAFCFVTARRQMAMNGLRTDRALLFSSPTTVLATHTQKQQHQQTSITTTNSNRSKKTTASRATTTTTTATKITKTNNNHTKNSRSSNHSHPHPRLRLTLTATHPPNEAGTDPRSTCFHPPPLPPRSCRCH